MSMVEPIEEAGSKLGLTSSQKGTAVSKLLPKPKTSHPYLVGLILIGTGGLMLIGSITGTLPSMLAALFVPQALVDSTGKKVAPNILSAVNPITSSPTIGTPITVGTVKDLNNWFIKNPSNWINHL